MSKGMVAAGITIFVGYVLVYLAVIGGIVWTALHFIHKYW